MVAACLGAFVAAQFPGFVASPPAGAANDPVVAAAGDIGCDPTTQDPAGCPMHDTANLVDGIKPQYLLPLGDIQYADNLPPGQPPTPAMYTAGYDSAWGQIPSAVPGISVNPTAGSHDWADPNDTNSSSGATLANYINYFGSKGELRSGVTASHPWYSFDIPVTGGSWHVIALDNECGSNGGCGSGSPMETFLLNDLAGHPNVCTLAYWHRPYFSSGAIGNRPEYVTLWTDLANAKVSIVLGGSDHDYERFDPQTPSGQASSTGIAQYVVGTGGAFLPGNFGSIQPNSAYRDANDYGVLTLSLHATGYDHAFHTVASGTVDSGTTSCSNPVSNAPSVTFVSPSSGPAAGGTQVTVSGTNFSGATAVKFGGTAATGVIVNSATQITATAPAVPFQGTVDVTVTGPGGTSITSTADRYTYVTNQPSISSVAPSSGPAAGGTAVTITGTNLAAPTAVRFGSFNAASFSAVSPTQVNAVSPAGTDQTVVDVTVGTANGTSAAGPADRFTYGTITTPPTVAGVNPISGSSAGGNSVAITGSSMAGTSAVMFGAVAATGFTVNSPGLVSATPPAGTTTVDVRVTNGGGTSAAGAADQYTYTFSNNGYAVSLSASTTTPAVGASVMLTATANKDVGPTPYGLGIVDATTGTELIHAGSGTTVSTSVSQSSAVSHRYLGYVSNANMANAQANSTPIVVAWGASATPPSVSSVSPNQGSSTGGTAVTITGSNFAGATAVRFGTTNASFTVGSATSISATSPGGAAGTVDVTVTTPAGTSAVAAPDQFTYPPTVPSPTVASVSPSTGSTAGGTSVAIGGTNLTGASMVKFGTVAATAFTVNSATQITATSPAGAAGLVDITVTTGGGTSATSGADQFTYFTPAPTVSSVTPNSGTTAGGSSVAIGGTNLTGASAVRFGVTSTAVFTVDSATQITATSPTGAAGLVDITVTTAGGTSGTSGADQFTYMTPPSPPAVSGVSPNTGSTAGGTNVVISGSNFNGASAVKFGSTPATAFARNAAGGIDATSPPGTAGTVHVTVTTPGGTSATSAADQFTYVIQPPAVTGINPSSGPTTGGTSVAITGTNLTGASSVKFGTLAASGFTVNSATQITATSPAAATGTLDITVTSPAGTSPTGSADQFTYADQPPVVTAVNPNTGPTAGGTSVTISGSSFTPGTPVVHFGGAAGSVTAFSATSITAMSPAGAAGTVDVTVTTPAGTSATGPSDKFTYADVTGPPTVSGVSPISGPSGGGNSVAVSGTNFSSVSSVQFGSVAASSFTVNSTTQITATAPAGTTTLDITVVTSQGSSGHSAADQYTYTFSNNGYAVRLSASASSPTVGASVNLTATANKDVGPTPYGISIIDVTTGVELVHVGSGATVTTAVSQSAATTQRYVAFVSNGGGANAQADSTPVVVTWGGTPTPPAVSAVGPASGSTVGGTSVTITGTNLTGATAVRFGAANAASFTAGSAGSITAVSPAGAAGTVDITVTTPGGTSPITTADRFTFVTTPSAPSVTSLSPNNGPVAGGTSVVIGGTGFTGASAVKFATAAATGFTVNSATQITATAPAAAAGTVDVTVVTSAGTSPAVTADQYTYNPPPAAPAVSSIAPATGVTTGGTSVVITGTGFTGASAVEFGTAAATGFTVNSATQITATAPAAAAGTVDVTVTNSVGTSGVVAGDRFTYTPTSSGPPSVTGVNPVSGDTAGGNAVVITGSNLTGATSVRFGSVAATGFTVNSATQITATAPGGGTATVDVTVVTSQGTSPSGVADEYTYTFSNNGYAISLSATSTTPSAGTSVNLTATANQDVGPTPYGLSIIDVTTGVEVVHVGSGTTVTASVSQANAATHRYVAFVSNAGGANAQAASAPMVITWR